MIENRVIVLMRHGHKLLFPTSEPKYVDAPTNTPHKPFIMCRIKSYESVSGKMQLQVEPDLVDADAYSKSIEVNNDALAHLNVMDIALVDRRSWYQGMINQTPEPKENYGELNTSIQKESIKAEQGKLSIELPVKDVVFLDGKVCFGYYISVVGKKIEFEIDNPFIKKEHDSIKNYFPKALNVDRFRISIEYEYLGSKIFNINCKSPEIMKINESLLEIVEEMHINNAIINNDTDDIINLKELAFDASVNSGLENIQDVGKLLKTIITPERTKHYYHLRYLSEKHLTSTFNLKITGKPLSFIFLLSTKSNYYLVWETYSTAEATYVWRIPAITNSTIESESRNYIETVKHLRAGNKNLYLRSKPDNFKKIEHDYSGNDMGFKKWKRQLDEFMDSPDEPKI